MPYSLFWSLNPRTLEIWQINYNYDVQDRLEEEDVIAWNHGMYVMRAILAAFNGKQSAYPSQAYMVSERLAREEEQQHFIDSKAAAEFGAWVDAFNKQRKG